MYVLDPVGGSSVSYLGACGISMYYIYALYVYYMYEVCLMWGGIVSYLGPWTR